MASHQALRWWINKPNHRLERALRVLDSPSVNVSRSSDYPTKVLQMLRSCEDLLGWQWRYRPLLALYSLSNLIKWQAVRKLTAFLGRHLFHGIMQRQSLLLVKGRAAQVYSCTYISCNCGHTVREASCTHL